MLVSQALLAADPLVVPGLFASPLGRLVVAMVLIAVIILVGKVILNIAWRLLMIAAIVVATWYILTIVGIL